MVEIKWQIQSHSAESQGHSLCFRSHWALRCNSSTGRKEPSVGSMQLPGPLFSRFHHHSSLKRASSTSLNNSFMKWGSQKEQCFIRNSPEEISLGSGVCLYCWFHQCAPGWEFQGEVYISSMQLSEESQGRRLFLRTETSGHAASNRRIKSREMKKEDGEGGRKQSPSSTLAE